jgi:endonuclease/exonuclease/phosphatase (EEP) superfamily protein YafD
MEAWVHWWYKCVHKAQLNVIKIKRWICKVGSLWRQAIEFYQVLQLNLLHHERLQILHVWKLKQRHFQIIHQGWHLHSSSD